MKTNPDPENEDALLEAVLRDDGWQAANAAGKAAALRVFQARQRVRRVARWGGGATALAVVAVCAAHWLAGPVAESSGRLAVIQSKNPPAQPERSKYLTDGELIALFPPGSCFLAEVDGQKKLVFFDPQVERQYISDASPEHSFTP
jgi:hypothetical protein